MVKKIEVEKAELTEVSFEEGLKSLEELVTKVESGNLPLSQAVSAYEKGVGLVENLRKQLTEAEVKLEILKKGS